MRAWVGEILKPCYDVRGHAYNELHDPDDYSAGQAFTRWLLGAEPEAYGIAYRSMRHPGGACLAALRPTAVSLPVQGAHLVYRWDGRCISHVVEQSVCF